MCIEGVLECSKYVHFCRNYHYGDQSVVRECCVQSCVAKGVWAKHVSVHANGAACRLFTAEWNMLSNAEMYAVRDELARQGITSIVGYSIMGVDEESA